MAVKIAHASIDENGRIAGGQAGDQTKREVCIRTWYNKNWDYVIRFKDEKQREKAAKFMEQLAANDNVGYDQYNRNTLITQAEKVNWKPKKIAVKCECDCSSAITAAAIAAGVPKSAVFTTNACTTRTLRDKLSRTGMVEIFSDSAHTRSDKYALRGDIYLKEGSHVIMVIEDSAATSSTTSSATTKVANENIAQVQRWLNKVFKMNLVVDGVYGAKTKTALIKSVQMEINVTADGKFGPKSRAAIDVIKKGSKNDLVFLWQGFLICNGYDPKGFDGIFGSGCETATKKYQRKNALTVDGEVGPNTWYKALN